MAETFYFYCAKFTKKGNLMYLKQKVKRVSFAMCENNCKRYKNVDNCPAYWEALEEYTKNEEAVEKAA